MKYIPSISPVIGSTLWIKKASLRGTVSKGKTCWDTSDGTHGSVFSGPVGTMVTSLSNWWLTYPPEKYERQIGSSSQLLGKIKVMFQTTHQSHQLLLL